MRVLHLVSAGSILLLAACGGASTPTREAQPLANPSSSSPTPSSPSYARARPVPSPTAARASRASSPAVAVRTPAAAPSPSPTTKAASPSPAPKLSPKPSPSPSPKASPKPSPTPTAGKTYSLQMVSGFRFSPSSLTIAVGDAVRVHNSDSAAHTFTGPTWDSGNMNPGQAQTFRFAKAGTFSFVCSYHQAEGMTGTLTVR